MKLKCVLFTSQSEHNFASSFTPLFCGGRIFNKGTHPLAESSAQASGPGPWHIQISELDLTFDGSRGPGLARLEASVGKQGLVCLLLTLLSASALLTSLWVPPAQVWEEGNGTGRLAALASSGDPVVR